MSNMLITGMIQTDSGLLNGELDGEQQISGVIAADGELVGEISGEGNLSGEMYGEAQLDGELSETQTLEGLLAAAYGTPGVDGGYYIPSVNDGELSWQPSKIGMPSVSSVNINGKDGRDGKDGIDGKDGQPGPKGDPGEKGEKGDPGEPGPEGPKGADGVMSFEDLTEEQKASLKGDKGDPGPKGDTGEQGPKGEDGRDGLPGKDGADGKDGEPGAKGEQGEQGIQGIQGEQGPQGVQGEQGPKGDPGEKGADGKPGADGQPGKDGISPVISVSDITGGHRIAVTDANGTKTLDVMDGTDGSTPQKGVDYFTVADKGQIVSEVLAGLPTGTVSNAVTLSTAQTVTGVKTFTASNFFDGEQKLTFGQYCPTVTDIASGIGASMKNARAVDCQLYVAEVYAPYWGAGITHGGKEPTSGLTANVGQIDFYTITGAAGGQPTGRKLIMQMKEDGLYVLGKKVKTE